MARLMLLLFAVASMIIFGAGTFQKRSLPTYTLKISKDGKDYDEQVSVDVKKQTETFYLRESSSGKNAGVIIYDFKRNLTMIRVPEACFLHDSTTNIPKPAQLLQLLKLMKGNAAVKITPQSDIKLKADGTLKDRSGLSKEMMDLCAKLQVYRLTKGDVDLKNLKQINDAEEDPGLAQLPAKRTKRGCSWSCSVSCRMVCSGWRCHTVCSPRCGLRCTFG